LSGKFCRLQRKWDRRSLRVSEVGASEFATVKELTPESADWRSPRNWKRSIFAGAPVFVINGLKREELIASNSMILHELYFNGLGIKGEPGKELRSALMRDFGSVEMASSVRCDG
jgi:hypothetical protein